MDLSYMLNQMCHVVLTTADINAIRKARGFKEKETTSRATFESFFLSSIGLEAVMATLTPEESATLHLLSRQKEAVDVSFFERLYGNASRAENRYYGTFTQRYRETYDEVKKSLLRKGLLVMAEAKARGDETIMERWRFRFPPEFAIFLPRLLSNVHVFDAPAKIRTTRARTALLKSLQSSPAEGADLQQHMFTLAQGSLKAGDRDFQAGDMLTWQQAAWERALGVQIPINWKSFTPTAAIRSILSTLGPGEWVAAEALEPILKIYCDGLKLPAGAKLCEAGWEWGQLARYEVEQRKYYRLPDAAEEDAIDTDPADYLHLQPDKQTVSVDLKLIPFDALEQLNQLLRLEIRNQQLVGLPDQIKLGRAAPEVRQSLLGSWLYDHLPAFQHAADVVNQRWGKIIVHSNLLVARVRDLSLRVQLQRELGDNLVLLSAEFVAFPSGWRAEVEKVLRKGGYVVKEIQA